MPRKLIQHMARGDKQARADHDATSQDGRPISIQHPNGYESVAGFKQRSKWADPVLKFEVSECWIIRRDQDGVGQATRLQYDVSPPFTFHFMATSRWRGKTAPHCVKGGVVDRRDFGVCDGVSRRRTRVCQEIFATLHLMDEGLSPAAGTASCCTWRICREWPPR